MFMLTLIGLGPADTSAGLSFGAWDALSGASGPKFIRAGTHAALVRLDAGGVRVDAHLDALSDGGRRADGSGCRPPSATFATPCPAIPCSATRPVSPLLDAVRREAIPLRVFAPAPLAADTPADFEALRLVMARLRDPVTGCPWDREQNAANAPQICHRRSLRSRRSDRLRLRVQAVRRAGRPAAPSRVSCPARLGNRRVRRCRMSRRRSSKN